jgi:hypothetical protein
MHQLSGWIVDQQHFALARRSQPNQKRQPLAASIECRSGSKNLRVREMAEWSRQLRTLCRRTQRRYASLNRSWFPELPSVAVNRRVVG